MRLYRYDAIVFDFDGTLVNSNEIKTWAFGELYKEHGENIVRQIISYNKEHEGVSRFVKFRYWQEDLLGQPYTKEIGKNLSRTYSQLVFDTVVQAPYVEGALEFLKKHYQHIPLFVASGTPEPELREIVLKRNMNRFFRGVYGSPASKSEILQKIIRSNKLVPESVLMIGDALSDLDGAQPEGTGFVGILNGKTNPFPKSTLTMQNLNELNCILKGMI